MNRQEQRFARSQENPIVAGLPNRPGILAIMALSPGLERHLRGLADELLVNDFPFSTLTRAERELIATCVSARNDCIFCMDSHGAFAAELLRREGGVEDPIALVDYVKEYTLDFGAKMSALAWIAEQVRQDGRALKQEDVDKAVRAGASSADVQLTILISSAFCMFNRMVDGVRAQTPPTPDAYRVRAVRIADHGYNVVPGTDF